MVREFVIGARKGADGPNYHEYLSTACWHLEKENCRLECKYCSSPCVCDCHKGALEACGMSLHVVTRVNVIGNDRDAAGCDLDNV